MWGPMRPGTCASPIVHGGGSWALWWVGLGLSAAGSLEVPTAASVLVGGAVSLSA